MLAMSTHRTGSVEVVELDGEFDLHAMAGFRATVDELLQRRPVVIEIDAGQVSFIDSGGLRALLIARKLATSAGVELCVTRTSEPVDRVLAMTGLDMLFGTRARAAGPRGPVEDLG